MWKQLIGSHGLGIFSNWWLWPLTPSSDNHCSSSLVSYILHHLLKRLYISVVSTVCLITLTPKGRSNSIVITSVCPFVLSTPWASVIFLQKVGSTFGSVLFKSDFPNPIGTPEDFTDFLTISAPQLKKLMITFSSFF